jgi:CBS domain-containing protein
MTSIKPSPALTLSEHTSIGETIHFLSTHEVGSVIITAYDDPHRPVGIFTERDLLKWALQLGSKSQWNTAIGNIMTKGLITVKTDEMDRANDLMVQHHIRHIPVVFEDDDHVSRLAGVISMRDAFKTLIEENKSIREKFADIELKPSITVLAKTTPGRKLQTSLLANRTNIHFLPEASTGIEVAQHLPHSHAFVFDIDLYDSATWTGILRKVLESGNHPDVFLILDPKIHEVKILEALKTMQTAKVLYVFHKPINLIPYLEKIEIALGKSIQ